VTGPVADVRPYLAMASVACIPLVVGSGTKYKVLEAMSAGVPVVCTPVAAEGMHLEHRDHVWIAHSNNALADAVCHLLGAPDGAARMAQQARNLVVDRYSWERTLDGLDDWLERLRQLPRRVAEHGVTSIPREH